jgi:hypothetical protein
MALKGRRCAERRHQPELLESASRRTRLRVDDRLRARYKPDSACPSSTTPTSRRGSGRWPARQGQRHQARRRRRSSLGARPGDDPRDVCRRRAGVSWIAALRQELRRLGCILPPRHGRERGGRWLDR